MEDQQPDSGDLTTEDGAVPDADSAGEAADASGKQPEGSARTPVGKAARTPKAPTAQPDSAQTEDAANSADSDTGEAADTDEAGDVNEAEAVTLVPHRPAGKRLKIAAVAASVLFVGAGGFAGAMVQPYLTDRALVDTKLDIARTAANAITTLWTYTPEDMGTLADRASRYLAGDFANDYRTYIDAIVEPNKQAQVTNTTEVMGAAVESVSSPGSAGGPPSEATAIVYTNSVATSPVTKNIPSLRYLSYRLTMQRDGAQWMITRMSTVTSFDLTPQL